MKQIDTTARIRALQQTIDDLYEAGDRDGAVAATREQQKWLQLRGAQRKVAAAIRRAATAAQRAQEAQDALSEAYRLERLAERDLKGLTA